MSGSTTYMLDRLKLGHPSTSVQVGESETSQKSKEIKTDSPIHDQPTQEEQVGDDKNLELQPTPTNNASPALADVLAKCLLPQDKNENTIF
ncbi:hypothetical protein [Legionella nagasakiensis]|uniref:hypothetical protein n=1 Tax=Legionella nagasakiensis TaxID=535290 RepID=UPI00105483C2|nr:hypothetical protein [Legionella nagasakiensis]